LYMRKRSIFFNLACLLIYFYVQRLLYYQLVFCIDILDKIRYDIYTAFIVWDSLLNFFISFSLPTRLELMFYCTRAVPFLVHTARGGGFIGLN